MQNKIVVIDKRQLRTFGIMMGCMISLLFGLVLPYLYFGNDILKEMPIVPWAIGLIFITWALLAPASLKPIYLAWMKIGGYLGWFNTRLILTLVFIVMFVPFALIMKIIRRDVLTRKFNTNIDSYRKMSVVVNPKSMERPF